MINLSIITVNLNNSIGLKRTIESVLNQSCKDFEYIIIDGQSNDGSSEIINIHSNYITKVIIERDHGVYNAMNKGIQIATGVYCLFLNSGDFLANDSVLENIDFDSFSTDFVFGNLILKNNPDSVEYEKKVVPKLLRASYLFNDYIPHPSTFIRRELFNSVGFFNENLKITSDREFFLKAILLHNVKYSFIDIDISVFITDGMSSKVENAETIQNEKELLMHNFFPHFFEDNEELLNLRKFFISKEVKKSLQLKNKFIKVLKLLSKQFI